MDRFERREGETDTDYQIRLSLMKLIDREDIDWNEIAELLGNGQSGDHVRKTGYGVRMYHEKCQKLIEEYEKKIDDIIKSGQEEKEDKRLRGLQDKIHQLEMQKLKNKDEISYLKTLKREIARLQHFEEILTEGIKELNNTKPIIGMDYKIENKSNVTGVALISDIHLGCDIENVVDKFNPNICKQKFDYHINKIIEYGKLHNIDELYIFELGDTISGIIHETNRYSSRLNAVEQITVASEMLSEGFNKLSKHFYCKVGMVAGNHSRLMADKSKDIASENLMLLIKRFVVMRLKYNKNVEFINNQDKEEELLITKVRNKNFFITHGDRDRDCTLDRAIEMFKDLQVDYFIKGHYHQPSELIKNNTVVITNGCYASEDYAKRNRLYCPPIQKFLIFNDDGLVCSYNINLQNYNK